MDAKIEQEERCKRAWKRINDILVEEKVSLSISHLRFQPNGTVTPVMQIQAVVEEDAKS